jgi:excisionase family DNA binding protein
MKSTIYSDRREPVRRLALKAADAANTLGISESQLRRLTKQGLIGHVRVGRAIVWPMVALEEFLASSTRAGRQHRPPSEAGDDTLAV